MVITGFQSDVSPALARPSATSEQTVQNRQAVHAAKSVNESGILGQNQLVVLVDRQTHQTIFRIVDRNTQQVISQIPPEYVLRLAQNLGSTASQIMNADADT